MPNENYPTGYWGSIPIVTSNIRNGIYVSYNGFSYCYFRPSVNDAVYFQFGLPLDAEPGAQLWPVLTVCPVNGNAGKTRWEVIYTGANVGEAIDTTNTIWQNATLGTAVPGVAYQWQDIPYENSLPYITSRYPNRNNWIPGSAVINCLLSRRGSYANDTYLSNMLLGKLEFRYLRTGLGGRFWDEK